MSFSPRSIVQHPRTHLSQLLPDKIYGVGRAVSVKVSIVHMGVGGKKEERVIMQMPLTVLLHEAFKRNAPDTIVGVILANPPADITKTDDIICKITNDPTAIQDGVGDILEDQTIVVSGQGDEKKSSSCERRGGEPTMEGNKTRRGHMKVEEMREQGYGEKEVKKGL